jgi:hypothetical protein
VTSKAFVAFALASGVAGCSLVSGWSDLEGGSSGTKDSGSKGDASTSSGSGGGSGGSSGTSGGSSGGGSGGSSGGGEVDAGASESGSGGGITCNGASCVVGDGCCYTPGNIVAPRCTTQQQCNFGGVFAACTDSRDCSGQAAQTCCLHGGNGASCSATCDAPDLVMCDPKNPSCGAGRACGQTSTGGGGLTSVYVCQ